MIKPDIYAPPPYANSQYNALEKILGPTQPARKLNWLLNEPLDPNSETKRIVGDLKAKFPKWD